MAYIFGPVPSRRLGLSLGIDLIPSKTCTYDCLYCQVGRTTHKTVETRPYVPLREVFDELERNIEKVQPDTITLTGSGEPTLHSEIGQVIAFIKSITDIKIAILTNGSLFWREELRRGVLGADIILPTLSTVSEETFRAIHRPHSELNLKMIIEGLKCIRREYQGRMFLEVVLLAGFNDNNKEIGELKRVIEQISPDKIQLNTVVRPPADSKAISLDRERLEEIKESFGERAEIIAEVPLRSKTGQHDSSIATILAMAKRRPIRAVDIANVMNLSMEEISGLVKGLLMKGVPCEQEHFGETYYSKRTP